MTGKIVAVRRAAKARGWPILIACVVASAALADEAAPPASGLALEVDADFLALHVNARAPQGTTAIEYRLAETGDVSKGEVWAPVKSAPREDGAYRFDVALPKSRWTSLQVRAVKGGEVLAMRETHPRTRTFQMLTEERVAALPAPERDAWTAYLRRSGERAETEHDTLADECRTLGLARSTPAPSNSREFETASREAGSWFAGAEAQRLGEVVMSYQTPSGGWSKAVDYTKGARTPGTHWTTQTGLDGWHYCGTLDNRSTTEQVRFLAALKRDAARTAALRGIEWMLEAQMPNGGWPQNYPVEPGYHEAITLNDDAMVHALEILLAISAGEPPFDFTEAALRERTRAAFDKGIACLAAAQVREDGTPTVWCAQHDPLTLVPVAARKKEPPSLSGGESAAVLKFLMRQGPTTPEVVAMVEPALRWFERHRVTGLRQTKNAAGKTDYVPDAGSEEVYWARFYDVTTGQPIFAGAEDGIIYPTFSEMAAKNKVAYEYFTTKPRDLIEKEVARWKKRLAKER